MTIPVCHNQQVNTLSELILLDAASGEAMEVDDTNSKLLGPEQHAALRGGVFWLDPLSSQSQVWFP